MGNLSEYLYKKASINKVPLNGTFELSPVCNFACKMCYIRKTEAQIRKEGKQLICWTKWLELAKEAREAGMLYLLLTGGEPFIYPGFKELYTELHKMGFLISINTNGTLIDDEALKWLKEAAPHRVNITLYGTSRETYEKICGNGAAYDTVVENILRLKDAGIQVVVNASMIPENQADLEEIIAFGKKHNIGTRIATYMFPPVRREEEETDSRFSPKEAAEIYLRKHRCYLDDENYRKMIESQIQSIGEPEDMEGDEIWGSDMGRMRCRAGRSTFWISWEGKMTACGMLDFPKVVYPFEREFKECWMELTDTVRSAKVLKECNRCEKKEVCNPCVAMLNAEEGDVNCKPEYICQMTDSIIEEMKKQIQEVKSDEDK